MDFFLSLVLILILAATGIILHAYTVRADPRNKNVVVLVLGDLGHSPRMQNHALSLARHGFSVDLVGFSGSAVRKEIAEHTAVRVVHLHPPEKLKATSKAMYMLRGMGRTLKQIATLSATLLWRIRRPKYLIVQNPPAIPTLAVAQLVCLLLHCRLVIDWHNFGFSLMPETFRRNPILDGILQSYEKWCGRYAYLHTCVTEAMANELRNRWHVKGKIAVVYDKPADHFAPITADQIHHLFCQLDTAGTEIRYIENPTYDHDTVLTLMSKNGRPELKPDRPSVIISSTSWTPDEDFSILMDALVQYEQHVIDKRGHISSAKIGTDVNAKKAAVPNLLVIITGKGPLKQEFAKKAQDLGLKHTHIKFAWLEPEDYPLMVGSADLGVSLHTSSSGLDLPMKIIDMFGCGVPACSYYYPTIAELVQHEHNGLHFRDSQELFRCFVDLFEGFPNDNAMLEQLRSGVGQYRMHRWEMHWEQTVLPELE